MKFVYMFVYSMYFITKDSCTSSIRGNDYTKTGSTQEGAISEVFINESVPLGMKLVTTRSGKEQWEHFITKINGDSIASQLPVEDGDRIVILNLELISGYNHVELLSIFSNIAIQENFEILVQRQEDGLHPQELTHVYFMAKVEGIQSFYETERQRRRRGLPVIYGAVLIYTTTALPGAVLLQNPGTPVTLRYEHTPTLYVCYIGSDLNACTSATAFHQILIIDLTSFDMHLSYHVPDTTDHYIHVTGAGSFPDISAAATSTCESILLNFNVCSASLKIYEFEPLTTLTSFLSVDVPNQNVVLAPSLLNTCISSVTQFKITHVSGALFWAPPLC